MAKKSQNPAEAHRKALRKKELQKNKENRAKAREVATLKKDTSSYEAEIKKLEEAGKNGEKIDKSRLSELRSEVERIKKTKADYVTAHPEHKHLVYRNEQAASKRDDAEGSQGRRPQGDTRLLFGKDGKPLHPERSIYYDPIMNPFGFPPPGMPYVEKAIFPQDTEGQAPSFGNQSSEEDDSSDDDDIPLPPPKEGAAESDEESDDSDDIPMPQGPPPLKEDWQPPLPPGPPPLPSGIPPFPSIPQPPPPPVGIPVVGVPGQFYPPPPAGFTGAPVPVPPGFGNAPPISTWIGPPPIHSQLNATALRDPLSDRVHKPYQQSKPSQAIHSSNQGPSTLPPAPKDMKHPLPANPHSLPHVSVPSIIAAGAEKKPVASTATISAEPELRDFKKESTTFVPAAVKRKKNTNSVASGPEGKKLKINAAPVDAGSEGQALVGPEKPDLMATLKEGLGDKMKVAGPSKKVDDYDAFLSEMGDIL